MLVKYIGGSTHKTVTFKRKERYFFTKDNDYTLDLRMEIVNHIIKEEPSGHFEIIEKDSGSDSEKETDIPKDEGNESSVEDEVTQGSEENKEKDKEENKEENKKDGKKKSLFGGGKS